MGNGPAITGPLESHVIIPFDALPFIAPAD